MKILITGVAGFIGSCIAKDFILKGHDIYGVDDLSNGKFSNIPKGLEFIKGDLSNKKIIKHLPNKCDYILHLAGQSSGEISFDNPVEDLNKNTISTLNLIDYGIEKKVKKFIYASSMSVYGDVNDCPIHESNDLNPLSCYGIGKLASERYLKIFSKDLPFLNLRMFNVYGPGQDLKIMRQGMVSIFVSQALKNNSIHIKGSLDRFRDFIFIDDVVKIWHDVTFNDKCVNLNINIGSGTRTTMGQLMKKIKELKPDITYYSKGNTPGDQQGIYCSNELLANYYDLQSIYSLDEGLKKFFEWAIRKI